MASTTTNAATITMEYTDKSTRNITFNDVTDSALSTFKGRVLNFNNTLTDSVQAAPYKETFISDDGYPIARISKAKYTVTEEQVIYRG